MRSCRMKSNENCMITTDMPVSIPTFRQAVAIPLRALISMTAPFILVVVVQAMRRLIQRNSLTCFSAVVVVVGEDLGVRDEVPTCKCRSV